MKKDSHINKSQMKISFMSAVVSDCAYIEGSLVKGFVKEQYSSVINHQGPSHVIFTHVKCSLLIKLQVAQLTQGLRLLMCSRPVTNQCVICDWYSGLSNATRKDARYRSMLSQTKFCSNR